MDICFVGLGSIAKRHIKNLNNLLNDNCNIDVLRHSIKDSDSKYDDFEIHEIYELSDLKQKYDAIFVTNPTNMHFDTIKKLADYSDNFFIEKPVFESTQKDLSKLSLKKNGIYYVAAPLRYCNVIQYVKEKIDFDEIYSVRVISSSYLPDWRPNTDYRDTYSAHSAMGGGVSIDLIHEWDYISYLIGFPQKINAIISKKSDLEIDSDDIAIYIGEYKDKTVEIHLDYFGRQPVRKMELYGKNDTIIVDLIEQKIEFLKQNKVLDLSEERDAYQTKELKYFLDLINKKKTNENNIEHALNVLKLARGEWN